MSAWSCPACGAHNAAGAPWCTQCYRRVDADAAGPARPDAAAPSAARPGPGAHAAADGGDPPAEPGGPEPAAGVAGAAGDVRVLADGEVEWRCATCGTYNPLAAATCGTCGGARTGFGQQAPPRPAAEDTGRLVAWSLLVPGLGHLLAGRAAAGVVRALLGVGWLVGAVLLARAASGTGTGPWAALPLAAGAGVIWVASALDVRALGSATGREHLDGRRLLGLVVAVTAALLIVLLLDTLRIAAG